MRSLSQLVGIFLLAFALASPATAATTRSIKIGVKMKEKPINDDLFGPMVGLAIRNMYILKVKAPGASKGKWDLVEHIGLLTGPEAFRPLEEGECPLVEQARNN